jgi:DNA repair protein RecN (Recombination protein N)
MERDQNRELAYQQLLINGENVNDRLKDLSGGEERILEMKRELSVLFKSLKDQAQKLTESQAKYAKILSDRVSEEIRNLSMPNAFLEINVHSKDCDSEISYQIYGLDEIEILFCSHQGGKALPLNKVASGGELSRVMLAIEVVIAATQEIGTYIFDEVDAGVGGKAAI